MKQEKAIKILTSDRDFYLTDDFCESDEGDTPDGQLIIALNMGIDALYRNIPRIVLYSGDGYSDEEMVFDMASCPNCGCDFEIGDETWESKFCPNCGQALKWEVAESKEEEKNDNTDGDS